MANSDFKEAFNFIARYDFKRKSSKEEKEFREAKVKHSRPGKRLLRLISTDSTKINLRALSNSLIGKEETKSTKLSKMRLQQRLMLLDALILLT